MNPVSPSGGSPSTYESCGSLWWQRFRFLVKTDDDVYLHLPVLQSLLAIAPTTWRCALVGLKTTPAPCCPVSCVQSDTPAS